MLVTLVFTCALAAVAAAPATYDQRQEGMVNVHADLQNVLLLVALPQKMSIPSSVFDGLFSKNAKPTSEIQERADIHVTEAFVEPSTPYKVEIGSSGRDANADGRAVEVVIAGRRRPGVETLAEAEGDELKLLGATEQCGPDSERDPVSLRCRLRSSPAHIEDKVENVVVLEPVVVPAA